MTPTTLPGRLWLWVRTPVGIAFVAHTALAALLCGVPLFNVLAYEFAFAVGMLAAVTSPVVGVFNAGGTRRSAWLRAAGYSQLQLTGALLLITLNALRVRNCNYFEGLGFFVMLPCASALYGAWWGVAVGRIFTERLHRIAAIAAVIVVPFCTRLYVLYTEPPIFAFDHLWGHFAGSLYDEGIVVDARLLAFRLGTLLRCGLLVGAVALWEQPARPSWLWVQRLVAVVAAVAAAMLYDRTAGPPMGFYVTRAHIEAELSDIVHTDGLVLHLPPGLDARERQALVDDHRFRRQQLQTRLGTLGPATIHSYVYRNAQHKARWMGGRGTMVAKPWLHEIHIHTPRAPHPILGHELAHVMIAPYGSPLLGVSARFGVLVNMGWVEGVAEALSPPRGPLDLHAGARALRDLGYAPDLRRIVGPTGFWSQAPRRAYTIVGSFVFYLLERFGPEPLKQAYRNGDLEGAYGQSLDALSQSWGTFIDDLELSARDRREAEDRYRRPSIFRRPCAHVIADLRIRAQKATPAEAVQYYRRICAHLGNSPSAQQQLAQALYRAQDTPAFMRLSAELLSENSLTVAQRSDLLQKQGRVHWAEGRLGEARDAFRAIQSQRVGLASERLQWVQLWALELDPEPREALRRFLTGQVTGVQGAITLADLEQRFPTERTVPYLLGRQLVTARGWEAALRRLENAGPHPFRPIEAERIRLTGEAAWRLGQLDQAADAYARYAELAPNSGERARAQDWLERIRWHQQAKPR